RAPAARREARGDHRAGRRDPARSAGHLRLPGEARPHGGGPAGRRRADGAHRRVDRVRGGRRRGGRGGGDRQAARGDPRAGAGAGARHGRREAGGMNPSRLFILRPVATSLLMVAIMLAGVIAYHELPVSALPQVDYPTIQVLTFYPGAGPDVMASSVTAPLERQFGQMPGLKEMLSTSSFGSSVITLQFALDLSIDVAEQEVQAAINAAATYLPRDLPNPPIYSKTNPADAPVLTLGLTSDSLPLAKVQDLADTRLAQKIAQLPGVGLVSLSGGQKPAVRIQANPTALAAYDLSLEDVRAAIAQANVNQAKGNFEGTTQAYTIGANDPQLASSLPPSVSVTVLTDRTATIRASVRDVQFSLMLTVALVVMVLFLFLRSGAATVIPSVAVPLSIVGTFGVMYLLGYSLDNLSLMALTISTGFV